jgi:tetraacyldisaccharide 4'-kinase
MRAPAFWRERTPTFAANLLRPLGFVYGAIAARRLRRHGERLAAPIICVGNFTVGGAGKTPTAMAVARLLRQMGERPAFLTRGYGGRIAGPVRVDPDRHDAADVGDEPLLLARLAPTIVSRDRAAGARRCLAEGASVVVMDDGLQNPSLRKDLTFAVVDAETGLGNRLCLPAGPLRAPMTAQWRLVDAIIVVGNGAAGEEMAQEAVAAGKPVLRARLEPDGGIIPRLRGRRVLAFAGIGRPEKFFATVEASGAVVERSRAFPDHHVYSEAELRGLRAEAACDDLLLATTEKDLVRLGRLGSDTTSGLVAVPVRLAFADAGSLRALLASTLSSARAQS